MNPEIQTLVDGLAEKVRQPVGVDDRRYRAVAYSSHGDDVDAVRRASILGREAPVEVAAWLDTLGLAQVEDYVRVPGKPELDMLARVCFPLRFHDRLLGFLWLVDDHPQVTNESLGIARTFAPALAESLFRIQQQRGDELQRENTAVHELIVGSDAPIPELAAAACYAVAVLTLRDSENARDLRSVDARLLQGLTNARRLASPRHQIAAVADSDATVVLAGGATDELASRVAQIRETTTRELLDIAPADLLVGVGTTVASRDEIPSSFRRARLALRAARLLNNADHPIFWVELGPDGLILELLDDREPGDFIPAPLRHLQAASDGASLIATLSMYLEHAGRAPETSAALFVHRSSLYHRLHRIEQITGFDLRSGAERLELHIGLRLLQLAGELGETVTPTGRVVH